MKTALVYDYVPALGGGAERALLELAGHFSPDIELFFGFVVDSPYSRQYLAELRSRFGTENVHTGPRVTFLKPIMFRIMNFLLPSLLHAFDLKRFDTVFSYTSFIAHSIIPPEKGKHYVYMNTPARFLWNLTHSQSLLKEITASFLVTDMMRFRSQLYDLDAINHVDKIFVISRAAEERVKTFYNLDSTVLYPASIPDALLTTDYNLPSLTSELGNYFAHVSRIESYKNIDLLLETVIMSGLEYTVIIMGDGPYLGKLKSKMHNFSGTTREDVMLSSLGIKVEKYGNVLFTGYIDEAKKMQILAGAQASFSLNDEDFGITKVESLAVGTPVIGLAAGATPEIIEDKVNGILFYENTRASLMAAVKEFSQVNFNKETVKNSAIPFTTSSFHANLTKLLHA